MLKKLTRLTLGKSDSSKGFQTQSELFPVRPGPALGELPEITVQVEESSSLYNPVVPQPCMTCGPLTTCTEQPVPKEDLFRSADSGCSICYLLSEACSQADDIDRVDYVSTWSSSGGVFGIYLSQKGLEDEDEVAGRAVTVMVLASDGGKFTWLAPFSGH
jgi:hypothetical protein